MKRTSVAVIHLSYWVCYAILLFFIFHILSLSQNDSINREVYCFKLAIGFAVIPALLSFYISYFVLFTKFLKEKKIIILCASIILVCYLSTSIGGATLKLLIGHNLLFEEGVIISIPLTILMSSIPFAHGILGLGMRTFIAWFEEVKLKEELSKKNYETELALVKSQINPHFLFNTINNIDSLIEIDASKASNYLNKLSDIMRFMLYETKTEKIVITKELYYIEKYIELQKIRTANEKYVSYTLKGNPNSIILEPMLFIPFIENAFKHAENVEEEHAIRITFEFTERKIVFVCENKYLVSNKKNTDFNGLGNELIKKRLFLLFPENHNLLITNENGIYKVCLVIT